MIVALGLAPFSFSEIRAKWPAISPHLGMIAAVGPPKGMLLESDQLGPITQRIDDESKSRRGLPAARIVKVIARKRRTPVGQNAQKSSVCDMRLHLILGHIGKTDPGERSVKTQHDVVEDKLAFDPHLHLASALFELPHVNSAPRGQADIDAVVTRKILRRLRRWPVCEI